MLFALDQTIHLTQKTQEFEVLTPFQCVCCQKVHDSGISKPEDTKDDGKKEKKDEKKENTNASKDDKDKANRSAHDKETYTDEENAKIVDMKNSNASWAAIALAIGKKSKSQIATHYKTNLATKSDDDKKMEDDKKEKAEKAKAEGLAKQAALKKGEEQKKNEADGGKQGKKGKDKNQHQKDNAQKVRVPTLTAKTDGADAILLTG